MTPPKQGSPSRGVSFASTTKGDELSPIAVKSHQETATKSVITTDFVKSLGRSSISAGAHKSVSPGVKSVASSGGGGQHPFVQLVKRFLNPKP